MEVFVKAAEFLEIPVRRSDDEPLQKLFMTVRSELNLDLKNIKKEQAKFWKQHPALVKVKVTLEVGNHFWDWVGNHYLILIITWILYSQTELLIQAHFTRETASLSPDLEQDCRRVLEFTPRLLEELIKVTLSYYSHIYSFVSSNLKVRYEASCSPNMVQIVLKGFHALNCLDTLIIKVTSDTASERRNCQLPFNGSW